MLAPESSAALMTQMMPDKLKESSTDLDPTTVLSRQEEQVSFARLDLSDNANSGDDTLLSGLTMRLGKRDKTPSPIKSDQMIWARTDTVW